MRIHHLGYLVKDMEKALATFLEMGYTICQDPLNAVTHDQSREILISFIERDGYRLELIAPTGRESKMYPLLKRQRNTAYHICYESECVEDDLKRLAGQGWSMIDELAPAPALGGCNVCFLLNPAIGMIELIDYSGVDLC